LKINEINKSWDFIIGLEIHVQIETKSKIFSECSYGYAETPNSLTCPTSIGLPGALPNINQSAIESAIKFGKAVNGKISKKFTFARKHYFYPDLPKGYQISQFNQPIIAGGFVPIWWNEKKYNIDLTRAHLEEDAGKSSHDTKNNFSNLDYNRSGAALIEIVTEPVLIHPEQAKIFMQRVKQIINYISISNAEMEQGKLRCDANISLSKKGSRKFGVKTEIKNINSFKNVQKAIESEIIRQNELLNNGKKVEQATLTWNNNKNTAEIMRLKENADDYRYFNDPDLPPVNLDSSIIDKVMLESTNLPFEYEDKWISKYDLSLNEASILATTEKIAKYFESVVNSGVAAKKASAWISTELFRLFNEQSIEFDSDKVSSDSLTKIIVLVESDKITQNTGKKILREVFDNGTDIDKLLNSENLDTSDVDINSIINKILFECSDEVSRFKNGEEKLMGFFIGQVNRETQGKVSHKIIIDELKKVLNN
jgi:aspartyl-tRNA(Asn)/glutamyl-tRNA(Gln) amidotransferase subunit B|tara:strand:+ start:5659 stop:7104 length:1446 start_codon:yes stop_codon:yes gene_type:complete